MGQLLPAEAQLVEDPYGASFTSPAAGHVVDRESSRMKLLASLPGMRPWILYMQVRTRVIDDALREFLKGGGRQVVLLGAGYDCRALRMPELADANVFEVDHPATQARKRRVLDELGVESPATYVTWDFEARAMEDLPDELASAGLDLADPVFTIWEGVTMYLTEPAIDASLRAIRAWSHPGSQLAMTYFAKHRIARPTLLTRAMKAVVSAFGEPWKFGWRPEDLPDYLAGRKFSLVRDIALSDAARDLLPARYATQVANPDRRFTIAAAQESIAVAR
jgi:methyltransferase (TIGR00027 family)